MDFREYDLSLSFALPWAQHTESGWEVSTRLMASAGVLDGAGKTALVVSLVPLVAFVSQKYPLAIDLGVGGALLSRHQFANQQYGGALQFVLTAGVGVPLSERLRVGYRLLHYSDAKLYGQTTVGADFHMLEMAWRL